MRIRRIPARWGSWCPFVVLQRIQAQTTLVQQEVPPLESGTTVRDVLTTLFLSVAERACSESGHGCLVVKTMITHGDELPGARERCLTHTGLIEERFRAVLERGQERGEIAADANVADLAKDLRNILFGLWVSAAVVGDLEDLRGTARRAIQSLP